MRKFVCYLLSVILGVIFIDFCFGVIMKSTLESTTKGDWGRRNYIMNSSKEDVLIFGASRAVHHYDTKILSDSLQMSCYNCGDDGKGVMVHLPRFKKLIQRYHPRIVLYEIAPNFDFAIMDNTSFLNVLRPYSDDTIVKKVIRDIDKKELLKLHLNLYKYNSSFVEILLHRFSHDPSTAKDFTYSPLMSVMNYEPQVADLIFEDKDVDEVKMKYLTTFIDLCLSNDISVFLTSSPWYKMQNKDAYKPVYELCKAKGVPFLDHTFDNTYNTNKVYFHDAAHLNQYGAKVFSAQIAHEIKDLLNVQQK